MLYIVVTPENQSLDDQHLAADFDLFKKLVYRGQQAALRTEHSP